MGDYTLLDIHENIGLITLNRPHSFNALDLPTAHELADTLLPLSADPTIHGIIITGSGKAFSAGGDIRRAVAHPQGPAAAFHELATYAHICILEIRRTSKPVIAAINGVAAGGGFSLALACDFRGMAQSARLKQDFTSNALCIDAGGPFMLPRLVGLARALEIAAFDEPISPVQALAWSLVRLGQRAADKLVQYVARSATRARTAGASQLCLSPRRCRGDASLFGEAHARV